MCFDRGCFQSLSLVELIIQHIDFTQDSKHEHQRQHGFVSPFSACSIMTFIDFCCV